MARLIRLATRTLLAVLALAVLAACVQLIRNSGTEALTPPPGDALRLATHNVHYIVLSEAEGDWSRGDWEARKPSLDAMVKALDADVIAFQEMESFQRGSDGSVNLARDYLAAQNPGYAVGATGPWEEFPPTQPIFYREDRLRLLDQGWYFFSDTPDVIYSRTFNGSWPAFASWVRLEDRTTGKTFRVVNVHFEYRSGSNRLQSAELVAARSADWIAAGETVFLVGDLNARLGAPTLGILEDAGFTFSPVDGSTYHFDRGINLFGAIDHLAYTDGVTPAGAPVVVRRQFAGDWPSDHYPVVGDFLLP